MDGRIPGPVVVVSSNSWAREGMLTVAGRLGIAQAVAVEEIAAARPEVARLLPTLIVIDRRLRSVADVAECRALREKSPKSRIMTLSWYSSERDWLMSLLGGASACILMEVGGLRDLLTVIDRVIAGENLIHQEHGARLDQILAAPGSNVGPDDLKLMDHICELRTDGEIASLSGKSVDEVRTEVAALVERLSTVLP